MSLASSGYLELGMFDAAVLVLEEIAPDDKNRNEVLGARVILYMAAKKWEMAEAIARHLVEVQPENEVWWRSSSSSANCRMSLLSLMAFSSRSLASTILPLTPA